MGSARRSAPLKVTMIRPSSARSVSTVQGGPLAAVLAVPPDAPMYQMRSSPRKMVGESRVIAPSRWFRTSASVQSMSTFPMWTTARNGSKGE